MGDLSEHFSKSEMACSCGCGFDNPSYLLVQLLESIRSYFNKPIKINSACRCEKHNKEVGGEPNSQHVKGNAADINVVGVPCSRVWAYLNEKHRGGLGRYDTFTHVDVRGYSARWDLRKKK